MNDFYNSNEHRCYPFIETTKTTVAPSEILDCRFFIKNAESTDVYLKSRIREGNQLTYTFNGAKGDMVFSVPDSTEWRVVWVYEDDWYGFCAFGDTTNSER